MVTGATGSPAWGQAAGLATGYFANRALQPTAAQPTAAQPTAAQPTTAHPGGGGSAGSAPPSALGDDAVAGDQGAGGEDGDPGPDPDPAASVPEPESTLGQMSLRYSPGEQPDIFA